MREVMQVSYIDDTDNKDYDVEAIVTSNEQQQLNLTSFEPQDENDHDGKNNHNDDDDHDVTTHKDDAINTTTWTVSGKQVGNCQYRKRRRTAISLFLVLLALGLLVVIVWVVSTTTNPKSKENSYQVGITEDTLVGTIVPTTITTTTIPTTNSPTEAQDNNDNRLTTSPSSFPSDGPSLYPTTLPPTSNELPNLSTNPTFLPLSTDTPTNDTNLATPTISNATSTDMEELAKNATFRPTLTPTVGTTITTTAAPTLMIMGEKVPSPIQAKITPTTRPTTSTTTPTTLKPAEETTTANRIENYDIIIVGAGWSGLAAADWLYRNETFKNKFLILEARDYIGGRSHTIRDLIEYTAKDATESYPIELGSSWIYPSTELYTLANRNNIPYGITSYRYDTSIDLYQEGYGKLSWEEQQYLFHNTYCNRFVPYSYQRTDEMFDTTEIDIDYEEIVEDYVYGDYQQTTATSDQGQMEPTPSTIELTHLDREFILSTLNTELVTENGASLQDLSSMSVGYDLGQSNTNDNTYYTGVPGGGYDTMINVLANKFPNQIQLNSKVTQMEWSSNSTNRDNVVVHYTATETNEIHTLHAKVVLVTVPLGVLKEEEDGIEFVPTLPQSKRSAIERLGFWYP